MLIISGDIMSKAEKMLSDFFDRNKTKKIEPSQSLSNATSRSLP